MKDRTRLIGLVGILAALTLGLAACKGADLRKQADSLDKIANTGDRAADALDRSFATADAALAWAIDPVNQAMIGLFPPAVQARINQAITAGTDLRPVLAEGVVGVRDAATEFRNRAGDYRDLADQERSDWINLVGAIVIGLTGAGSIGGIIGRAIGMGTGAARVAQTLQWGKIEDPEAAAKFFDGPAGEAAKTALAEQPAAVRRAVQKVTA